jgi:cyd operon protein YbgT
MWYFTWILGLLLACSLGIINVLRLEAQETWDREHVPLDPLTRLITKDTLLMRLREKVENSKRNGLPFSVVFLSLTDFTQQLNLSDYEADGMIRSVVDCIKNAIREPIDITARLNDQDFLIAMPGVSQRNAEAISAQLEIDIIQHVKTPGEIPLVLHVGVTEYSMNNPEIRRDYASSADEVSALIKLTARKCGIHTLV